MSAADVTGGTGSAGNGGGAAAVRVEAVRVEAVRVSNLRVSFGRGPAVVDGVSFEIRAGECFALVGESGSGKSVTARTLIGLAGAGSIVTADELEVAGRDIRSMGRRQLERLRGATVGTIGQDALAALDPLRLVGREVDDALRLHTRLSAVERRARVLELLADAGIPDPAVRAGQRSGQLSGGLRQRALIAAALAASPGILIADEPTTALDAQVRDGVLDLVSRRVGDGTAVLLISHDLAVVRSVASRVAVMKDGRIVEQGNTVDVLRSPQHPYTRALLASSPAGKPRHTLLLGGPGAGADSAAPPTTPRPATSAARDLPPEPATPLPPALTALGLSVAFAVPGGTRPVLDDVSFTLPAGRTLGLVGPSGSGKTTIARIALGLQKADAGELRLFGEPWSSLPERERRPRRGIIGAVYQDPLASFDPRLTVGQILGDAVGVDRRPDRGTARNHTAGSIAGLLDSVGLAADTVVRRPRTLSGGQRQRVAIARALGAGPRVLVLDEPVSSLDVSVQAQILDLLDSLQRELGLSYLFISHDTDVIVHMSDEVLDLAALAQTPTQTPTQRAIG